MNFKAFFLLIVPGVLVLADLHAQESDKDTEELIEMAAEIADENFDYTEAVEKLDFYRKNPINLNKASREQLQELFFISPLHINALISHRETCGLYIDLLELQAVEGLDLPAIKKLLPFITLNSIVSFGDISAGKLWRAGENEVLFRYGRILERQSGYSRTGEAGYLGDPNRLYSRYRCNFQNLISAGITMEKDAGEGLFYASQRKGFDFYSGFVSLRSSSALREVVAGDFSLQFGQGLSMWSGLGFGKGPSIASVIKKDIGLKPYSSTNEGLFLRGAAGTVVLTRFKITPFISYRFLDGTLNEQSEIKSINQTGFHRTQNESDRKNNIGQLIYGSSIEYEHKGLKLGSMFYRTEFDRRFESEKSSGNTFDFTGSSLTNTGFYYNYARRNTYFFGEIAHSLQSGFAYLHGLLASLSKEVSVVVLTRNYQKNYHSFFSQALAESSSISNEKAIYTGLVITPSSRLELSAYADVFQFPGLKFRVDGPSKGYEVSSQLSYSLSKRIKATIRYRLENKEENDDEANAINFLQQVRKQNYRGELVYKINDAVQLKNRIEVVDYKKGATQEWGYLMSQDLSYNSLVSKLSGNFRFAIFDTKGFDSRIYAYENDVLYGYSIPALQNKGIRFYVNCRYRLTRSADLWLRYAVTSYYNIDEIGSGLEKIAGNRKSEIKAQIRLKF